jgi:hypothetical protein
MHGKGYTHWLVEGVRMTGETKLDLLLYYGAGFPPFIITNMLHTQKHKLELKKTFTRNQVEGRGQII